MNLYFGRRDRLNQEMASSLPASLFLLSVVFCQFVSAADQNNVKIKATPGENVILPCEAPDQKQIVAAEWSRTDLESGFVLLYRDSQFDLINQNPSYRNRVDLLVGQIQKGDFSLILKNTTTDDSGTYECDVVKSDLMKKRISSVSLVVTEPFPTWATVLLVLLVLLVLAQVAAAIYYLFLWRPASEPVEVESGEEFVLLPFKVPRCLWFCKYRIFQRVDKVEWKDEYNRTVHVYQNGSDQPGEQNLKYRTRTKMDENLLKTGDLSLTLRRPSDEDEDTFTCRVYNRKGDVLMMKDVRLKVKALQVMVETGEESVLLPCRTTENLDGDVKVEWKDGGNRTVHVYQNGSDQPGEQDEFYKTRTKMDENLLKNKNLSLTLSRPTRRDGGIYTCRVYRGGDKLMMKQINLQVKVPERVEVESGVESVLLPCRITEDLDGDVKVEWKDKDNKTVHVYQNGSDQPGEQDEFYRTRTKMDENLLENKNLSLTLSRPLQRDEGTFTCRVYNRDGDILMVRRIWLIVKVPERVEVESGVESVLLPCRTRENLDGDVKVEWKGKYNKTVHVYQNGSDQPGEQNLIYKDRTKMDENLLKKKDLSLTLKWPTGGDRGTYTCRVYNRKGEKLMEKDVRLQVTVLQMEVETGAESVLLPWRIIEDLDGDVKVEWKDKDDRTVHVYPNGSDQPGEQDEFYRTRTKMDENLLKTKDLSLTLKWPTRRDEGIYTCCVSKRDGDMLMKKQIHLWVKVQQVEVESGEESVLLPWRTRESLGGDVKVEWRDSRGRTVHVYQDGSDQHGEQNQIYRTRTKMDENLLKNKDLSLTLRRPTGRDGGTYTCRVYSWKEEKLMEKKVFLQLKYQQVEVEEGAESVLLPCRTRESLDGDIKVEWRDRDNRTVHVYQNGSDQPGEQDQIYRTRTKMDENLLKTKNLSLTLRRPTRRGGGTYTCRVYNRDGDMLMEKQVQLEVKVQQFQVEVEEGAESVLLPFRVTSDLLGGDRVEWWDSRGRTVHVYQNGSDQLTEQNQFYRTRTKMDENLLKNKDLSLTLSRPTERDAGEYRCKVWRDGKILRRKRFFLKVKVPEVEVEPGEESVLLPCRTTENLDGDVKVEWKDEYDDVVHVYQNGSDQPEEQNQIYRTRTKMDENLLENKDLSLTLRYPADSGLFTCRVYSRDGEILMEKQVQLKVKDHQVELGAESVRLPFTVTSDLLEGATVVWWHCSCRTVHVYQNGSDQPIEQNQLYRTRTKMDKNPQKTGDVSLTLIQPTERDAGLYECKVWRDGKILRLKWFRLKVKAGTVQVQQEDIRTRTSTPAESIPLMADQLV
ncbi:muscle M-line assembly protein unc-89-like [Xiphophorus hellerii]|uniref:muscle M-line assembly protein unc-89-like n=1 Tax=Xiphophorus hellerii TaxID=8084 RepID=UPI0013B47277|nr:muscle M-line assembly protein unc-89-like [Xiphophorus hellerii]